MKLIIELDVNASDFSEQDAELFIREAEEATGINLEVGRPISEELEVFRQYSLSTEYFKVRLER